jgi:hypothetical protein
MDKENIYAIPYIARNYKKKSSGSRLYSKLPALLVIIEKAMPCCI